MKENNSYAFVYASGEGSYGHIYLEVRDLFEFSRMRFKLTSQCGSQHSDPNPGFYAINWGIQSTYAEFLTLAELELATEYVRKLNKRLIKIDSELGYTTDFSETLHRFIRASGTNDVYISDILGSHRNYDQCPHYKVKLDGKYIVSSLRGLESDMLAKHVRASA